MKNTTNRLDAAIALLALLKRNIVAGVVGEMTDGDQLSVRQLCAECDFPTPETSAAIGHLISEVEGLISSLITQLEAEIDEIEQKITQARDVLESKPKQGSGLKVKPY